MKKFNDEAIKKATTKEAGKIKKRFNKAVSFGKDHWKGILGTGAVVGAGTFIKKRFFKTHAPEPMDFEQDTIENAAVDFGETFAGSTEETEEAVDTEE